METVTHAFITDLKLTQIRPHLIGFLLSVLLQKVYEAHEQNSHIFSLGRSVD